MADMAPTKKGSDAKAQAAPKWTIGTIVQDKTLLVTGLRRRELMGSLAGSWISYDTGRAFFGSLRCACTYFPHTPLSQVSIQSPATLPTYPIFDLKYVRCR